MFIIYSSVTSLAACSKNRGVGSSLSSSPGDCGYRPNPVRQLFCFLFGCGIANGGLTVKRQVLARFFAESPNEVPAGVVMIKPSPILPAVLAIFDPSAAT